MEPDLRDCSEIGNGVENEMQQTLVITIPRVGKVDQMKTVLLELNGEAGVRMNHLMIDAHPYITVQPAPAVKLRVVSF